LSKNIVNKNKRIQQGKFKLNTLLQVTKSINNNLPKQELTAIYKDVLINQLNIGKILLYSFDGEKWYQELSEGAAYDFINVEQDLLPIQEITFINSSSNERLKDFDVVVAMYHDQALIPIKMLDFRRAVNLTIGLPFIRTSVDHGVAYDIAGKGTADYHSMVEAIKLAARLSSRSTLTKKTE